MDEKVQPNAEMLRLRDMLDAEGIEWEDNSDEIACRTQRWDAERMVFSAICGVHAYGTIEVWTWTMRRRKEDPVGCATAEEAFALIREEVEK
jgi:hypothetical protein